MRAARGEGALEARQVAEQQRMQLQQERQQRLHHLQDQEQQVWPLIILKLRGTSSENHDTGICGTVIPKRLALVSFREY